MLLRGIFLLTSFTIFTRCSTAVVVQGDCTLVDHGLLWLQHVLSPNAIISCCGEPLQQWNAQRYWGEQYSKNASAVVFPATPHDVSLVMQALHLTPLIHDFAFVSGGHGMTNASSASGLVMDLAYLNRTSIVPHYRKDDGTTTTAIMYQGGCRWGPIYNLTAGTGYTAVAARDSDVGVGGFSTGGGIGFLAGAYGFAIDRLLAMDVVLPSGALVTATKDNAYADLFWALQGGGGQFGIVTTFYQEAAPEPTQTDYAVYIFDDEADLVSVRQNMEDWFQANTDPFSLVYWAAGYLPSSLATLNDPSTYGLRTMLCALRLQDPDDAQQPSYNQTFARLLRNLNLANGHIYQLPYSQIYTLVNSVFPSGYRRGFWGAQLPSVSADYLENATALFNAYIRELLDRGEDPHLAVFCVQYMFPGLNGHLPRSGADTAWPHATSGHQTLLSPAWSDAAHDGLANAYAGRLNDLAYAVQAADHVVIADYPNYISPAATGRQVWCDNLARLFQVKEKYDPGCLLHQGRVFASPGCVRRGYANVFA